MTIFCGQYRSNFNHCDVLGQHKLSNSVNKKHKIRANTPSGSFKVMKDGINRKHVCNFLLLINTNLHPMLYRFGVIAVYCSNFGALEA